MGGSNPLKTRGGGGPNYVDPVEHDCFRSSHRRPDSSVERAPIS